MEATYLNKKASEESTDLLRKDITESNTLNNQLLQHKDTEFSPIVSMVPSCVKPGETTDVQLSLILQATKKGKWNEVVEIGRSIKENKEKYKSYKSYSVPAFTAHGPATHASTEGMKHHNGLAFFDFDNIEDKDSKKESLTRNPYSYAVYDSFGGGGLVVVCKIPISKDADEFEIYHSSLRDYFYKEYGLKADHGAKSFKCLRLISYDPELFLNENSLTWKNLPELKPTKKKEHLAPNNNHRANILPYVAAKMAVGKSDHEIKEGLKSVHIDPESCCSDPEEIERIISDLRQRYFIDSEKTGVQSVQYCGFWTNNFKSIEVQLSLGLLTDVLTEIGFRILDGEYVLVSNGVIYRKTKTELYEFIINLVSYQEVTFKAKDVVFTVDRTTLKTKAQKELRSNIQVLALQTFEFPILRDSAKEVFLHFSNHSLYITKSGINQIERNNKDGVIWKEQIINHELVPDDNGAAIFREYIINISGDNYNAFRSAIGYLIRNYNGSEGMKVIWCCDENYEVGKNLGRTGKSLLAKAIGKVRKIDECSGKEFNHENQFKFQNIDRSTQVYIIDDVKSNFDFKSLYNYCTEGVEFSRKHRDRIKLLLSETPQLIITSNFPPRIEEGSSTTARLFILPFKDFYLPFADQGGVKAYHSQVFFDDWNADEWNRFYWLMADCALNFLQEGLSPCNMAAIRQNRLRGVCASKFKNNEAANDFVDWIYQYELPTCFSLDELITAFKGEEAEEDKQVFAACLKAYFDIEGISFKKVRERENGKQVMKWRIL